MRKERVGEGVKLYLEKRGTKSEEEEDEVEVEAGNSNSEAAEHAGASSDIRFYKERAGIFEGLPSEGSGGKRRKRSRWKRGDGGDG